MEFNLFDWKGFTRYVCVCVCVSPCLAAYRCDFFIISFVCSFDVRQESKFRFN